MDPQQILASIEDACEDLQCTNKERRDRAAHIFHTLRTGSDIELLLFVLNHARKEEARYQAMRALWETAVRHWSRLEPDRRWELDSLVLEHLVAIGSGADGVLCLESREGCKAVAVLLKRKWGEATGEQQFSAVKALCDVTESNVVLGMALLNAVVSEMGDGVLDERTVLGVPYEYHLACYSSFMKGGALAFLSRFSASVAAQALQQLTSAPSDAAAAALKAAMATVLQVLCWNYDHDQVIGGVGGQLSSGAPADHDDMHATIEASADWQHVMIDPAEAQSLLCVCAAAATRLLTAPAANHSLLLASLATGRALVRLCGAGKGLLSSRHIRVAFLAHLLPRLTVLMNDCQQEHVLVVSQIAQRVCCRFSLREMASDPSALERFASAMVGLACKTLGGWRGEEDQQWYQEAFGYLAAAWVALTPPEEMPEEMAGPLGDMSARMFDEYMSTRMERARVELELEDDPYEDDSVVEEELQCVGHIGRLCALHAVQEIGHHLHQRVEEVKSQRAPVEERALLWEELYWLIKVATHLMTEVSDEGEMPSIPVHINALASHEEHGGVIHQLLHVVVELVQWEDQVLRAGVNAALQFLSPTVSSALCLFLHRWGTTYLFPDARYASPALLSEYGGDTQQGGGGLLTMLLDKVATNLSLYPPDPAVAHPSAQLLLSLSRNQRVFSFSSGARSALLCERDAFRTLTQLLHPNQGVGAAGVDGVVAKLARAVVQSCSPAPDQLLPPILRPLQEESNEMWGKVSGDTVSHPELIALVDHYVQVALGVIGAGSCSEPLFDVVWMFASGLLEGVVHLAAMYSPPAAHSGVVVLSIIRLAEQLVDVTSMAMAEERLEEVARFGVALIEAMSPAAEVWLRGEHAEEEFTGEEEVRRFVAFLQQAANSLVDSDACGPLLESGLALLLPVLHGAPHLLMLPGLASSTYTLLQTLCSQPKITAQMQPTIFIGVLERLSTGLQSQIGAVRRLAVESFLLLSRFNASASGTPALSHYTHERPSLLSDMLMVLLEHAFTTRLPRSTLPMLSDAVHYLASYTREAVEQYFNALLDQLSEEDRRGLQTVAAEWMKHTEDRDCQRSRTAFYELRTFIHWKLHGG